MTAKKDFEESRENIGEFVPAVFARNAEDAEEYRELLEDHDIPAIIGVDDEEEKESVGRAGRRRGLSHGVPVLVPEALLDEASEIIADREENDDFVENDEEDEDDDEEEEEEFNEEELDEEEELLESEDDKDEDEEEDDEFLPEEDSAEEDDAEGLGEDLEEEDDEEDDK